MWYIKSFFAFRCVFHVTQIRFSWIDFVKHSYIVHISCVSYTTLCKKNDMKSANPSIEWPTSKIRIWHVVRNESTSKGCYNIELSYSVVHQKRTCHWHVFRFFFAFSQLIFMVLNCVALVDDRRKVWKIENPISPKYGNGLTTETVTDIKLFRLNTDSYQYSSSSSESIFFSLKWNQMQNSNMLSMHACVCIQ